MFDRANNEKRKLDLAFPCSRLTVGWGGARQRCLYLYATDPVSGDDRSPPRPQTHGQQLPLSTGALGSSARERLPGVRAQELSRCAIPHLDRPRCQVGAGLNQEEAGAAGGRTGLEEGERIRQGGGALVANSLSMSWCFVVTGIDRSVLQTVLGTRIESAPREQPNRVHRT